MNKFTIVFLSFIFTLGLNANTQDSKLDESKKEITFEEKNKKAILKLLKTKNNPSKLSKHQITLYYKYSKYKPFWIDENGIKEISYTLIKEIQEDPVLKPKIEKLFRLSKLNNLINNTNEDTSIQKLIEIDFILTGTYHQYMRFLSRGYIDWDEFKKELAKLNEEQEIIANWKKYDVRKNIRKLLYKAVEEDDIMYAINKVNYSFPKASELSLLIQEYEKIARSGGYTKIPRLKRSLRPGKYYPQITQLRQRLQESKDLENPNCLEKKKNCLELYDGNLLSAVKTFQARHGLIEDGIIGRDTIKRLNTPIEIKIKQIRINLERMRWMPRTLGEKFVLINIPEYKLKLFQEGEVKLDMAVVVGEVKNPTPVFSHKLSTIVLNPYWRIPQRIVKNEIIPKLIDNPEYLVKNGVRIHENWSHESTIFDMSNFDWSMYLDNDLIGTSSEAPMRFIQVPSERNPLGRIKFLFPNRYSVYMHDTPEKHFFKYTKRAFSHGCVRLEKPNELLELLALEDENIDYTQAQEVLKDIEKEDLTLKKEIPVHLVYITSWIDENGQVHFRDDIYGYDRIQGDILYKSL